MRFQTVSEIDYDLGGDMDDLYELAFITMDLKIAE